jgi:hypothetical protein
MSRVRRQSLIVEEKKPKDACSWGLFVGWGHEEGTRLHQRQVSRHQSKCRLGGLSRPQLSRLNGVRCGVSGMLLPPDRHPVGPFPRARSEPKVDSSPKFCATTSAAAIGQLGCRHQNSRSRKKWRNARRGGVPLAHSG